MAWNTLVTLGIMALFVFPATACAAEEQDSGPLFVEVRTTEVNPGKNAAYERLIGMVRAAQREAEWDNLSVTHQVRIGNVSTYYTATFHNSFTEMQPNNLFGDNAEEFFALVAEAVKSSKIQVFMSAPDIGRPPPQDGPPADFFTTLLVRVNPGSQQAYEEAVQKLVEATDKTAPDLNWFGYAPGTATGPTYRFIIPGFWATADDQGMSIPERYIAAFGEEEGGRWIRQLNSAVAEATTTMSINRPDLSYFPDAD